MISMFPIELAAVSERESDWFGLLLLQSSSLPTIHYKPILVKGGHHLSSIPTNFPFLGSWDILGRKL